MEKSKLIKTIKAAQRNDNSAISLLYSEYAKSVYHLAFKLTGSKEEAEDIMQNVFIIVINKISELRKPEAFESWLNRITANCCTVALRKRIQTVDFGEDIIDKQEETEVNSLPEYALNAKETARIISEAVDALPLPQKMCVYYHYYQGLTAAKIAEVIGENVHTVKSRIALAKKKIRTEITRIEKEQGVKLHGIAFITPALKLSVESVEVPKAIIESVWSEITAVSADSAVKVVASSTISAATGVTGLNLAALIGGVTLTIGVGVGLYWGTDWFSDITPIPDIINVDKTEENTDDYLPEPEISFSYGNNTGNIINNGYAAIQDDWIYYVGVNDIYNTGDYIYKIKADGTEKTRLNSDNSRGINIVGDWIYYINNDDDGYIYKIKTNGTEKTQLNSDSSAASVSGYYYLNVVDDWIYYVNKGDDSNNIYKIKTDGTERTKLNSDDSNYINVIDDWIYYCNSYDNDSIIKIKTDGSERTVLVKNTEVFSSSSCLNVVDGWIYFVSNNGDGNYNLYKIKTDGTEKTQLGNDNTGSINVAGDWIYYINNSDNGYIYKMKIDGTEKTQISNSKCDNINIAGDWIFYNDLNNDGQLCKIKTDGTEKQIIGGSLEAVEIEDFYDKIGMTYEDVYDIAMERADELYKLFKEYLIYNRIDLPLSFEPSNNEYIDADGINRTADLYIVTHDTINTYDDLYKIFNNSCTPKYSAYLLKEASHLYFDIDGKLHFIETMRRGNPEQYDNLRYSFDVSEDKIKINFIVDTYVLNYEDGIFVERINGTKKEYSITLKNTDGEWLISDCEGVPYVYDGLSIHGYFWGVLKNDIS